MAIEIKSKNGEVLKVVECLRGADFRDEDLKGANFRGADLRGADLRNTLLHGANLRGANLRGADLHGANLRDADLLNATLPDFQIPQDVEIIGYKKISTGVITLKIPAEARRTACLVSNKC